MQTVYVDVLVLTNFLVDYFLLLMTSKLCSVQKSRKRILLGALVASLSSLYIFLPELDAFAEAMLHLATALLICFVAFFKIGALILLKTVSVFYLSNALLAAFFLLVYKYISPNGIIVKNGEIFFDISPTVLILATAACYAVFSLTLRFAEKRRAVGKSFDMTVYLLGREKRITAMADNGNMLKDVCLDKSVVVASLKSVASILPNEFADVVKCGVSATDYLKLSGSGLENRIRLVPFSSVGASGVLPAVKSDKVVLHTQKKDIEIKDAVMAVCKDKIANGEYDALVNLRLLLN